MYFLDDSQNAVDARSMVDKKGSDVSHSLRLIYDKKHKPNAIQLRGPGIDNNGVNEYENKMNIQLSE